jgi:predicted O-methyltransferase YrrM
VPGVGHSVWHLQLHRGSGHLDTVEGFEPQFSIASSRLKQLYGDMVSCHFGLSGSVLPELVKEIRPIDFMFHDAGHTSDDYISDFNQASQALDPGAVVLIDDIRWEPAGRWSSERALTTHAGWKKVVGHSRVCSAVEIDGELGCLLLR